MDSHVLADAAVQHEDDVEGVRRFVVERLIDACCVVQLTRRQVNRDDRKGELVEALRKKGFRFPPMQCALIRKLDEAGKLRKPRMSAIEPLTFDQRKVFEGSTGDDVHLYEAAAQAGRIVITADATLDGLTAQIRAATEVETLHVDDALSLPWSRC